MFRVLTLLLIVAAVHSVYASIPELIAEKEDNVTPPVLVAYPEAAVVRIQSSLEGLSFNSTGDIIQQKKQDYGYLIILPADFKQILTVMHQGYKALRLTIESLPPKGSVTYTVERRSPASNRKGTRIIQTIPEGASVSLDGIPSFSGFTPVSLDGYKSGPYTVTLRLLGYESLDTTLDIEADERLTSTIVLKKDEVYWARLEAARLEAERVETEKAYAASLEAALIEEERQEKLRQEADRIRASQEEAEKIRALEKEQGCGTYYVEQNIAGHSSCKKIPWKAHKISEYAWECDDGFYPYFRNGKAYSCMGGDRGLPAASYSFGDGTYLDNAGSYKSTEKKAPENLKGSFFYAGLGMGRLSSGFYYGAVPDFSLGYEIVGSALLDFEVRRYATTTFYSSFMVSLGFTINERTGVAFGLGGSSREHLTSMYPAMSMKLLWTPGGYFQFYVLIQGNGYSYQCSDEWNCGSDLSATRELRLATDTRVGASIRY